METYNQLMDLILRVVACVFLFEAFRYLIIGLIKFMKSKNKWQRIKAHFSLWEEE